MQKERKFTFVEFLIIAIIAILASMLLPALNKSRKKAIAIACVSNLKQVGIAVNLYINDFTGYSNHSWYWRNSWSVNCAHWVI